MRIKRHSRFDSIWRRFPVRFEWQETALCFWG
nr:MAG TPA: hypothetical protein [Caudoviricetes sp.]